MVKMNNLVINTFPRSGTVFFTQVFSQPGVDMFLNAIHLPFIFDVQRFYQVTVARDPIEAISSNIYLNRARIDQDFLEEIKKNVELYILYASSIQENKNNEKLHIVQFERGTSAPIDEIKLAFEKWGLTFTNPENMTNELLIEKIKNICKSRELLGDRGGHMPREKTPDRLKIEEIVKENKYIEDALRWYDKLKAL